jgi:hypothetical protein
MADIFTARTATAKEVRDHYRALDKSVRITRDGHITFRANAVGSRDNRAWLEGGYVEDYRVTEDGNVHKVL